MPPRPILFDATRLFTRLKHPSPSGIDRVDLAYARRFLSGGGEDRAVAITPGGTRILPQRAAAELMRTVAERWREDVPADRDPVLADLRARLAGQARLPGAGEPEEDRLRRLRFIVADQLFKLGALRWPEAARAPVRAIYLHTSHLRLDQPHRFAWLERRPDIRPVFFLHDLIPIEYPEYAVPGEDERHRARLATMARHAAAVIVNSRDVERRFIDFIGREGWRRPPTAVAPLGVEPAFLDTVPAVAPGRPYLVVCSTIEARKNHAFLLQLWRDLLSRFGGGVPALVLVGRRGWESEAAIDLLDRSRALKGHVFEAPGLSTPGLAQLVGGAQALLMPSFAEGYGIPVVEALTLGTPVIASDIPVHREVAGGHAVLLDPLDGPAWADAIMRAAREPPRRSRPRFDPPTWNGHFAAVDAVLREV